MSGQFYDSCSCKMVCRCTLGPAEPDQGWCSGLQVYTIERGNADGVDLGGVAVAIGLDLPGDFFGGIDLARLYFDEAASPEQQAAIEAIITGTRGGVWGALSGAIKQWLPSKRTKITVKAGDKIAITIGDTGTLALEPLLAPNGKPARLLDAPVMAAFEIDDTSLALGTGTGNRDPEMRRWESLGSGAIAAFKWAA